MASRIAVMNRGRIVQTGTPSDIYERPNSRFVADFVGTVNLFEGEVVAGSFGPRLAITDADQPIPLPSGVGLPAGARIALALRPEKLRLSAERPAGFALAATVTSVDYQGGQSTIHLATQAGRVLRAHLPSGAAQALVPGTAAFASWSPEDAVPLAE
jgi:putrescine transport system ATP-binding protein